MYTVIMAGGSGTRFWPLSRQRRPKQFLPIGSSEEPLLCATVRRLRPLVPIDRVMVFAQAIHEEVVRECVPDLPARNLIFEPVGRNTAACIGLAAVILQAWGRDEVMAVLPSDHYIGDDEAFRAALTKAAWEAQGGSIVTLGMEPNRPETGYGYLHVGEALGEGVFGVRAFVEKPDAPRAEEYLRSGQYLWNSGMFFFKPSVILAEMARQMPELFQGLEEIKAAWGGPRETETLKRVFPRLPSLSIDYGVMEGASHIRVVPGRFPWSDVGSWNALFEVSPLVGEGVVKRGMVLAVDCARSVLVSDSDKARLLAAVGLRDMVVVVTEDAVLVMPSDRTQEVRRVVAALEEGELERFL